MKHSLIAVIVIAVALPASAVQNPDIRIYLDADPPHFIHETCPTPNDVLDDFGCLDCFGSGGGTRGTVFRFIRTFGGIKIAQINLLGGLDLGDVDDIQGWSIVAGEDCVYPDENGIVVAARVSYLYTGPPGNLDLASSVTQPRKVLDCNNTEDDLFCILANLGVCVPPNPGEVGCYCGEVPVKETSWGSIKALYR